MDNKESAIDEVGVTLIPVTFSDVSSLIKIHTAAFKSDQFSNLMILDRDDNAHQNLMDNSIQFWMSDPISQLVKAVDGNGEVVGWACWGLKGMVDSDDSLTIPTSESNHGPSTSEVKPNSGKEVNSGGSDATVSEGQVKADEIASAVHQPQTKKDPARVLGGLLHKDMTRWEDEHIKGRKYMVLQALATNPRHQNRGIGLKLVQWGIEKADAEDLPCWIHASPASYSLYKRAGFQELGKSDYDLDEWAPGGKGGNRGWGRYTFRYMLRPSRSNV